jgi:hypothetical protein
VQLHEPFSLTRPISERSIPLRFITLQTLNRPLDVQKAERSPRQTVILALSGTLRFPIGHVAIMGQIPLLIPRASLWAAMHALAASHVVASLALATCTMSTNDGADSGVFCSSKPHNYSDSLKRVGPRPSVTLGMYLIQFSDINVPVVGCSDAIAFALLSAIFWRGIKIPVPRLSHWFETGRMECAFRPLALRPLLRPPLGLCHPRDSARTIKFQEAGRATG